MTERKTIYLDDAMLKIAKVDKNKYADMSDFHDACVDCLKNLPSADRPKGRWEHQELAPTNWTFCSVCGRQRSKKYKWYYCPNCGAEMTGVKDD